MIRRTDKKAYTSYMVAIEEGGLRGFVIGGPMQWVPGQSNLHAQAQNDGRLWSVGNPHIVAVVRPQPRLEHESRLTLSQPEVELFDTN